MLGRQAARSLIQGVRHKSTAAAAASQLRALTQTSQNVFDKEDKYGAHNYHPLPVALNKAEGQCVYSR